MLALPIVAGLYVVLQVRAGAGLIDQRDRQMAGRERREDDRGEQLQVLSKWCGENIYAQKARDCQKVQEHDRADCLARRHVAVHNENAEANAVCSNTQRCEEGALHAGMNAPRGRIPVTGWMDSTSDSATVMGA